MSPRGAPHVTIVGAGVAGMSAALRLLEAGCPVTLVEQSTQVGGKFGAVRSRGAYHEHAYHVFTDACLNFFDTCARIGVGDARFENRPTFKLLRPLDPRRRTYDFKQLQYVGSPEYFWANVNSGVTADWSDMLIYGYSLLEMIADRSLETDESREFLNRVSVNGYMRGQRYGSSVAALLHNELLLKIFAVPSYETSARSYRTFLRLNAAFPYPHPTFRVLTGDSQTTFWEPFSRALTRTARDRGAELRTLWSRRLVGIALDGAGKRVTGIDLVRVDGQGREAGPRRRFPVDRLLVAIPWERLLEVARQSPTLNAAAPALLDLAHLRSAQVAALDLYFTRKLPGIPAEHVTLIDPPESLDDPDQSQAQRNGIASEFGLSFIDNSQLWGSERNRNTVLSVLAADYAALAGLPDTLGPAARDSAPGRIIQELTRYLRFDSRRDVDWERSYFQAHRDAPLFVNTVGSWEYRPEARLDRAGRAPFRGRIHETIRNLYLAGDYCRSELDIVSVEHAMVTGISAAKTIWPRVRSPIPPTDFDRRKLETAKAALEGWLELAERRSARLTAERRRAYVRKGRR